MVNMEEILKSRVRIFLGRTIWGTLLALFLIFMFHYFTSSETPAYRGIKAYLMPLWVVVLINFLFHGLLWLDRRLDRSIPWYYYPGKRLITEVAIAFPSILVILSLNYLFIHGLSDHPIENMSHQRFLYTYIILMIVFGIAISIIIANNFFRNWRKSLLEVEQLKREKMKSDYQALQNQLNPHFLFNNFNMLLSEIRRDPDNAVRITEKLSDVYRYVLESKNHETISLGNEAEFVEAIIFLHQVRFGDNLVVENQLPVEVNDYRLPPLTLQILIENALKHNVVSASHPLHIRIAIENDYLLVVNNIQPRKSTYSTGLGLKNIKMRYSYLTERKVTVEINDNQFTVKVPLLLE
jgi:two-component system LytT family sensor kinase